MLWLASHPAHWLREALGDLPWQHQHPLWQALAPRFVVYSPHLYTWPDTPDVWLLDLRSVQRLWRGDVLRLAHQLQDDCHAWAPTSLTAALVFGVGDSPWQAAARMAWALHSAASPAGVWSEPDVDALPLWTLSPLRKALKPLAAMGIRHWGELRALPRPGVMRRWGRVAIDTLDQAYAKAETPLKAVNVPDTFSAHADLPAPVSDLTALYERGAQMVQDLCAWLAARRCVATAIEWRWRSEKRQNARYADEPIDTHLLLRASEAHADPAVWWRLTQIHWQQQVLGQPAVAVYLIAVETYSQTDHTPSLWRPARGQSAESVGACLDRLQARLGVDAVRMVALHDAVAPEAQQQWRAYDPSASRRRVSAHRHHTPVDTTVDPREAAYQAQVARTHDVQLLRPPWLLQTPQRLLVREERPVVGVPLRLLMGPERMELVGWSEAERPAPVVRDYYVAWSASAGLLWVYKTQTPSPDTGTTEVRWYLHGLYG